MRFPGIRLVEQTEEQFHRIRDCLEEKSVDQGGNQLRKWTLLVLWIK